MEQSDAGSFIVTGGAGFVGSNLVAELLRRYPGAYVRVIDNFRSGSFANIVEACAHRGVTFEGEVFTGVTSDVFTGTRVGSEQARAVFDLGAITDTTVADEALMIRENTSHAYELAVRCIDDGVPLVFASSAATYGTPPQAARREPFPESAAGRPSNVYGFSKWTLERMYARVCASPHYANTALRIVGLRYYNVFGPGESRKGKMASMVYQLAQQMLAGRRPRLFAHGEHARDQVYVDDVVDCTIRAAGLDGTPIAAGVYNLGSGVATSFNEMLGALREGLGISESALPTEYFEMPQTIRAFYQDYTCADMRAAAKGLGWTPSWAPLDAIRSYAQHLRSAAAQ